jgi:pimeloyl-ACP methyl ester carboxylesterase
MPRARINGADLYYEEHGSGPALVFVHGGGGNHRSWWQQVPAFSEAGGPDLPSALARRLPAPGFRAPTLFVVGEQDEMIPPSVIESAAKAVAGARLLHVPDAGHSVYFERAEVFNAALAELLRDAEKLEAFRL